MKCNTVIISAGGTGGHIIPALNVTKELIKRGVAVHYIGNANSMEYELVTKHNIPFYPINVQKLYRKFTLRHIMFPFKLIGSIFTCLKYFKAIKPDAFIGFGGFVSGAPAIASYLRHCPIFIQEQNCRPGITNVHTGKRAQTVFVACEQSRAYFKRGNVLVTGNPIDVENYSPRVQKVDRNYRTLLILGGSQGSLFINNVILSHLDFFAQKNIHLVWQTGKKHLETIKAQIADRGNITVFDFTDTMYKYYQEADFAICRGGALTLAEIELYRIPAFVIPLSTAAVNEQYHNAKNLESQNKCAVFVEKELTSFTDRFTTFIEKAHSMYAEHTETLHSTAIQTIVDYLMTDDGNRPASVINKK